MQLNKEQIKLIQAKPKGHILIKGAAGAGKTTVAVHRVHFLLNQYCFASDDRILMVTLNKSLVNEIKNIYEEVELNLDCDYRSLFISDKSKVEIETIDGIVLKYFKEYEEENKENYRLNDDHKERATILEECMKELDKQYAKVGLGDPKFIGFLMEEFEWMKACNYMELEDYQRADRLGRAKGKSRKGPQKLIKNSNKRKVIFELMIEYNKRLRAQRRIDNEDMALYSLVQGKKKAVGKYTHIIIDESQELTRVQLEFLISLMKESQYSSMMFVFDPAKSLYAHAWLGKGRKFSSLALI
jgi:DNA helicase-2/ATP-dependent DNA helicase PcrA